MIKHNTMNYKNKTISMCFFVSNKLQGLRIGFDFNSPIALHKPIFAFELDILWMRFWIVKYKTND